MTSTSPTFRRLPDDMENVIQSLREEARRYLDDAEYYLKLGQTDVSRQFIEKAKAKHQEANDKIVLALQFPQLSTQRREH